MMTPRNRRPWLALAFVGIAAALAGPAFARTTAPAPTPATAAATPEATPSAPQTAETPSPQPSPTPSAVAPSPSPSKSSAAWVHPMPEGKVTSCYGPRGGAMHAGIDLATKAGTRVRAAGAGKVKTAGSAFGGYGISVVIDHGNGYLTHYAHLQAVAVSVGQSVKPGNTIGYEGSTGDSTGPHLHFEVHNGLWNQINPSPWMRARGVNLGC